MSRLYTLLLICTFSVLSLDAVELPAGYPVSDRTKLQINDDWKFYLGDPDAEYYTTKYDDSSWENICIPHTLMITDRQLDGCDDDVTQQTFHRTVGWYRRDIFVEKSNKKVYLDFEGVHQVTTLWVNGKEVGTHKVGGYTPFYFDITEYVKRGAENQVTILADNRISETTPVDPGRTDFVRFGGLYRDLYLVEKNPTHITSNLDSRVSGVTITTPTVDYINGNATIDIRTEIVNEDKSSKKVTLLNRVVDDRGEVVLKLSESVVIGAGEKYRFEHIGGVDRDLKLWSIDDPYLYKVNTTLYDEHGNALDVVDNTLGIRKFELDTDDGFKLNGKEIKLIGFNRHQNFGFIGDAMPNSLHYKDVLQLKQQGVNCLRTAHYTQDDEIMRACDELGVIVFEESPTWIEILTDEEWHENKMRADQAMVRNHKNHPSIMFWSVGVNHRGTVAESQFVIKQEDPTRFTASPNSRWSCWQSSSWADVFANMNYTLGLWEREEPILAMEGNGGPKAVAEYMRDPKKLGLFSWNAHRYYTFAVAPDVKPRPHNYGAFDIFRYPCLDYIYWYASEFTVKPYLHINDAWSEETEMLTIYSNADFVELFVNDKSQGVFRPSQAHSYIGLNHPPFEITDFDYEQGELRVVGYREREVIIEKSIYTPTEATCLHLFADDYDGVDYLADGSDIMVVHAEIVDKSGNRIRDYQGSVKFIVESGDAEVVGDDIATINPLEIYDGVAHALIRAGKQAGKITVTASSDGLKSSSVEFQSIAPERDMVVANAYPIKDRETIMVDMGGLDQVNQFGWTPWESDESHSTTITIRPATLGNFVAGNTPPALSRSKIVEQGSYGSYRFTLSPNSNSGTLNYGAANGTLGKDGYLYSDGILIDDKSGCSLTIESLPAGDYEITTYHHARLNKEKISASKSISISVNDDIRKRAVVPTEGGVIQYERVRSATIKFSVANDGDTVVVGFQSEDDASGIWINGFELVKYL